jgi:hypothetical protein
MTLTAKSEPPQTERGPVPAVQPVVDLGRDSLHDLRQRIKSINGLIADVERVDRHAAKAVALSEGLRPVAGAEHLRKLVR